MSKTTFIIAAVVSVVVHAAAFVPWPSSQPQLAEHDEPDRGKVVITPPPTPQEPPVVRNDPPQPTPEPRRDTPASQPPAFTEVVAPSADIPAQDTGDMAIDEVPDDALPSLRIVWDSPEQARAVARSLNMRIVAVDSANQVLGEVSLSGPVELSDFRGDFRGYSNRVRTLPRTFFGEAVLRQSSQPVAAIWLIIPADADRRFADHQRQAIRQRGLALANVRGMEAKFVLNDAGRYELRITQVFT